MTSPLLVLKLNRSGTQRITLGAGSVTCTLHEAPQGDNNPYNAAIDGMCSTLLALHEAGIDLSTPAALEAVKTAYDAIDNHHG